jgi:hypothetical protein
MKPIVFLVDEVWGEDGRTHIKTAYETSNLAKANSLSNTAIRWNNSYVNFDSTATISSENIRYESLADVVFNDSCHYLYLIPCQSDLDVCNLKYLHGLPEEQLLKLVNNNVNVLFDYSIEVFEFSDGISKILQHWGQVLMKLNPLYSGKTLISTANGLVTPPSLPKVLRFTNLPIRALVDRHSYENSGVEVDLDRYFLQDKKYLFLNLNMQPRLHRLYMLHRLITTGLITQSRTSFMNDITGQMNFGNASIDNRMRTFYENNVWLTHNKRLAVTADDVATIHHAMTVHLQPMAATGDSLVNAHDQNFLYNIDWVYDTYFDLVSETGGFTIDNNPVISEKFFKTVFYKRPFMINGDAGTLALIKRFGFQTFNEIFDESYDSYPNLFDRHSCIIDSNAANY